MGCIQYIDATCIEMENAFAKCLLKKDSEKMGIARE